MLRVGGDMIGQVANLVALGFFLGLDNFRTAVLLGPLRLSWRRMILVSANFGFWDGAAPLVGLLLGHYVGEAIGPVADYVGPIALGAYGLYLLLRGWRHPMTDSEQELEHSWVLFGLPLPLSVDNVLAGASLGLLGFSPWLPAVLFGVITAVMSFVGLVLGRTTFRLIRRRLNIRYEIVTGIALVIEAIVLGLSAGD
ncbi:MULTISPECIES: manganese efflux pump [Saccharopolyspora]|uniref:manganese efflux pump MntP n=1 Tax=Saccharopolyspora TaxID=1835 RepID=UPI001CC26859|nr:MULTISPECIES: manganese efflux pump [Saccharopolyspora]